MEIALTGWPVLIIFSFLFGTLIGALSLFMALCIVRLMRC